MQIETITIAVPPARSAKPDPSSESFLRPAADLSNSREREELSPSAIREFRKISEEWKLSEERALGLLGGVASSTWHAWRSNPEGKKLDQDTLTRISLVIGLYRALHAYFGDPLADTWITNANRGPLFALRPPIEYIIREGLPGLIQVRRLIEGWVVGH